MWLVMGWTSSKLVSKSEWLLYRAFSLILTPASGEICLTALATTLWDSHMDRRWRRWRWVWMALREWSRSKLILYIFLVQMLTEFRFRLGGAKLDWEGLDHYYSVSGYKLTEEDQPLAETGRLHGNLGIAEWNAPCFLLSKWRSCVSFLDEPHCLLTFLNQSPPIISCDSIVYQKRERR